LTFIKIDQPEAGEWARTPDRMTDKQTNRQTDTSTDNKGRLELSGAREPTDKLTDIFRHISRLHTFA